jgi:hypothetical protein
MRKEGFDERPTVEEWFLAEERLSRYYSPPPVVKRAVVSMLT